MKLLCEGHMMSNLGDTRPKIDEGDLNGQQTSVVSCVSLRCGSLFVPMSGLPYLSAGKPPALPLLGLVVHGHP